MRVRCPEVMREEMHMREDDLVPRLAPGGARTLQFLSPKIVRVSDLPTPGFDEWYVCKESPRPYCYRSSVNHFGFAPLPPGQATVFWDQVEAALPLHVLGAELLRCFWRCETGIRLTKR